MKNKKQHAPQEGREVIIVRYGELALKGDNRGYFEFRLHDNMKKQLRAAGIGANITKVRGRFFVHAAPRESQRATEVLTRVFGIVSVSPACNVDATEEDVVDCSIRAVGEYLSKQGLSKQENQSTPATFRVATKRINKKFPLTSMELNALLGEKLLERFPLRVQLTKPELVLGVEIYDRAYLFTETHAGVGGLPVGVSGKVAVKVDGPFGLLAAFLMQKRGCETVIIALRDVDVSSLQRFAPEKLTVHAVSPEEVRKVVLEEGVYALVDALMELPKRQEDGVKELVNLHPLVALNNEQVRAACKRYALACT
ncbi:hypothetical protein HY772_09590 [Candidatus Woesearchaeota archaeon]|nr:hypothetical protein [Candidatus Woesearchaeota archaeon]